MDDGSAQKLAQALFDDEPLDGAADLPRIPGYILHRVIGKGGGGIVYGGSVESTARPVAIKVLHARSSRNVTRALSELDKLAAVRSPVVPHVYEYGWIGNKLYIVTELIEGADPIEYTKHMSIREKVETLVRIADAVSSISARGIIHRDLKPSNILITDEGNPVILDLGIATVLGEQRGSNTQEPNRPIGTAAYMCPQQAMGHNDQVSVQWDVYSLGAIAYEMLTGSTPHGDASRSQTQAIEAASAAPPIPPRELNPDLPRSLECILLAACAEHLSDRYENPQQLRDDLNRWLRHEPVSVAPRTAWSVFTQSISRHPVLTVAILCAMIILVSVASMAFYIRWQNFQAYAFGSIIGDNKHSTSLMTRSGRILHTWTTQENNGIRFPGRIFSQGGSRYAVVGLTKPDQDANVGLMGYKVGHYDKPAWVAAQHVPDGLRYAKRFRPPPDDFTIRKLEVVDIFPERPGPELLAWFPYRLFSPCAIQVYTPDGDLLCEYYHDGYVSSCYFEPTRGVLYVSAQNSDGLATDRGSATDLFGKYPLVIFAIRPRIGEVQRVIRHPGLGEGLEPIWYKCLFPFDLYRTVPENTLDPGIRLHASSTPKYRDAGMFEIQLGAGIAPPFLTNVYLTVTPDGRVINAVGSDSWIRDNPGINPDIFTLGELPPRVTPRITEPSQTPP